MARLSQNDELILKNLKDELEQSDDLLVIQKPNEIQEFENTTNKVFNRNF